tara:strand:- start:5067 stop:5378 length:312 start_codon:yes stop_codon:yes gene_type:complete
MKKTEFDQMMKNSFADRVVNIPSKTDNQIIAEFMGIRYAENRNSHKSSDYYYEDIELEYHTSWDWLMPVIAKIVKNYGDGWIFEEGYDIKVRYKAVVKFIKSI